MTNKYSWEYFRKRKDGKLNRLHSRELRRTEVEDYIKNDWLQADLFIWKNTWYKIGSITTKGVFQTYNSKLGKFEIIPLNRLEDWLDLEEVAIDSGWFR